MDISPNTTDSEDEELSNEELSSKIKLFCNLSTKNVNYSIIVLLLLLLLLSLSLSHRLIFVQLVILSYLSFVPKQSIRPRTRKNIFF